MRVRSRYKVLYQALAFAEQGNVFQCDQGRPVLLLQLRCNYRGCSIPPHLADSRKLRTVELMAVEGV